MCCLRLAPAQLILPADAPTDPNPALPWLFGRGRRVLFDVAKGLFYLHQRRIVHLDLKSGGCAYRGLRGWVGGCACHWVGGWQQR